MKFSDWEEYLAADRIFCRPATVDFDRAFQRSPWVPGQFPASF